MAPLHDEFVDLGVRQLPFTVPGRRPSEFALPQAFFHAIEFGSQLQEIVGIELLDRFYDLCDG